jgi:hypothetical protein
MDNTCSIEMDDIVGNPQHATLVEPKLLFCISTHQDVHHDDLLALQVIFFPIIDKHHQNVPFRDLLDVATTPAEVPRRYGALRTQQ